MLNKKHFIRLLVYLIGIAMLALGGVLAINSQLGVSPVNLIQQSFSHSMGISLGVAAFLSFVIYVIAQVIMLGKEFKPIQTLQILFAVMFGQFIGFFNSVIQFENISIFYRIMLIFISIVVIAVGIFLTVTPKLVPMAPDGIAGAIAIKMKADFGKGKIVFDIIIVLTSTIILFLSNSGFSDIGIGTVLSALLVGRVVLFINGRFKEKFEKILF